MVIVKASRGSEASEMPDEEDLAAMGRCNEELADAGFLLTRESLHRAERMPSCVLWAMNGR